jgi:ABC-type phosphate transport system permease subunit
MMKVVVGILWVCTLLSCAVGGLFLLGAFGAKGAPQEAAAGALACAFAVVPYVATRAIESLAKPDS